MKCKKCGAMIMEEKEPREYAEESYESDDDVMAKDSVLADLIEAMQSSVGEKLKPSVMAIEIKKKG